MQNTPTSPFDYFPAKPRKIWGIFRRKPTSYEVTAIVMVLLFLMAGITPTFDEWVYQTLRVVWALGFCYLYYKDGPLTGRNRPFYFGLWFLSFMSMIVAFEGGPPMGHLSGQTWRVVDFMWIVAILRGAYTYHYRDCEVIAKPLF